MPDLYIDSNATGANNGTSWTDAYADCATAITGTWTTSETAWLASNHSKVYGANTTLTFPDDVVLISVNSSTDAYTADAEEKTTGAYDLSLSTTNQNIKFNSYGVNFTCGNNMSMTRPGVQYTLEDCIIGLTGTTFNNSFTMRADNAGFFFKNVDFVLGHADQKIHRGNGSMLTLDGGSINSTAGSLFSSGGFAGETDKVSNFDFSAMTTGSVFLISSITAGTVQKTLKRCKINLSSVNAISAALYAKTQKVDLYSCDIGDGYHYFEHYRYTGKILESTAIYRNGGATYDGTTNFSAELEPNANVVAYTEPLRFKLKEIELDLTSANTLTFHIAMGDSAAITASTITNDKYWIEIEQNDATDNALGLTKNTKPATILTTPSALANAATTWAGMSGYTYTDEFQIPITTTAVTGMTNGQVTVYLCCAEYVSTREVFVCPDPVIT